MMTTNFHHVASFKLMDLYPGTPGSCINLTAADDKGNNVTMFLDDAALRKLAVEMQRYAASREAPPVDPKPTYSEALFAPPAELGPDADLPF